MNCKFESTHTFSWLSYPQLLYNVLRSDEGLNIELNRTCGFGPGKVEKRAAEGGEVGSGGGHAVSALYRPYLPFTSIQAAQLYCRRMCMCVCGYMWMRGSLDTSDTLSLMYSGDRGQQGSAHHLH